MFMAVRIGDRVYRFEDAEIDAFIRKIANGTITPGFSILAIGCRG